MKEVRGSHRNVSKRRVALRATLLRMSYGYKLGHIPSALSMLDYWDEVNDLIDYSVDKLVIGKPYGAQAYAAVWGKPIGTYGLTDAHPNVVWADATLGNALGIAAGLAYGDARRIFVNSGDGCLSSGPTLEALAYLGSGRHPFAHKVLLCVDCNGVQLQSHTFYSAHQWGHILNAMGWDSYVFDGHALSLGTTLRVRYNYQGPDLVRPTAWLFSTTKGKGVSFMEADPVGWHYRIMESNDYCRAMLNVQGDLSIEEELQ